MIHGELPLRSGSPEILEEQQLTPWAVSSASVHSAPGLPNSPLSSELLPEVTEDGSAEASFLCHRPSELASVIK